MHGKNIVLAIVLLTVLFGMTGCQHQEGRLDAAAEVLMEDGANYAVLWALKNNTGNDFVFEDGGMCRYELMHQGTGEWFKGTGSKQRLTLKSGDSYQHTLSFLALPKGFYRLFLFSQTIDRARVASAELSFVIQ